MASILDGSEPQLVLAGITRPERIPHGQLLLQLLDLALIPSQKQRRVTALC